jgi:hypothetical protein
MRYNLIAPVTQNAKLGTGVGTSYRPVGDSSKGNGSCPSKCPLLPENGGSCYTKKFLVNNQQRNSWKRNDSLDRFLEKGSKFVRLHTSGDFFDNGQLDKEYLNSVREWAETNSDVTIWTYTHDVQKLIDAKISYLENKFSKNLHIVASCDSIEEKNLATEHGFRSARVIDSKEEKLKDETFCPYDLALHNGLKPNTNCRKCTLCFNPKHTKNIAFLKQK